MSLIGDNNPPGPDAVFRSRIVTLNKRLANLLKMEATEAVAAALRDVVADARKLELDLEAAKKTDKQPHLDANTAIEAEYRPLVSTAGEIKAEARKALDAFLKAEEDRLEREAAETLRRAEEALAKAAVVQAEAEEDPFADPEEAARAARLATIISALSTFTDQYDRSTAALAPLAPRMLAPASA